MSNKRGSYEARYKQANAGKNGGLGPVKSFVFFGKPGDARSKMRRPGIIISVRKAR